jgi:hypothetical protein
MAAGDARESSLILLFARPTQLAPELSAAEDL